MSWLSCDLYEGHHLHVVDVIPADHSRKSTHLSFTVALCADMLRTEWDYRTKQYAHKARFKGYALQVDQSGDTSSSSYVKTTEEQIPIPSHNIHVARDDYTGSGTPYDTATLNQALHVDSGLTTAPIQAEPEQSSCTWRVPPKKRVDVEMENIVEPLLKDTELIAGTKPSNESDNTTTAVEMVPVQITSGGEVAQEKYVEEKNTDEVEHNYEDEGVTEAEKQQKGTLTELVEDVVTTTSDTDVEPGTNPSTLLDAVDMVTVQHPSGSDVSKEKSTGDKNGDNDEDETTCATNLTEKIMGDIIGERISLSQSEASNLHQTKTVRQKRTQKFKAMQAAFKTRQRCIRSYYCYLCKAVIWGKFDRFRLHISLHKKYRFKRRKKVIKLRNHQQVKTKKHIAKTKKEEPVVKVTPKVTRVRNSKARKLSIGSEKRVRTSVKSKKAEAEVAENDDDVLTVPIPKTPTSLYLCAKCCNGFSDVMELVAHVAVCSGAPKASISAAHQKPQSSLNPVKNTRKKTIQNSSKTATRSSTESKPQRKSVIIKTEDVNKSESASKSSSRRRKPKVVMHRIKDADEPDENKESDKGDNGDAEWMPPQPPPKRVRIKKERPEYICKECGTSFKYLAAIKRHMQTHDVVKYPCKLCSKSFTQSSHLNSHVAVAHVEEDGAQPRLRRKSRTKKGAKSKRKKPFKRHYGTKSNPQNECPICHKCFTHHSALTRHKQWHTGERRHQCDICNMKFTQSCHLKMHIKKVHMMGDDDYKCMFCIKTFSTTDDLKEHLLIHAKETPFECILCKMKFKDESTLEAHVTTHMDRTDEKGHSDDSPGHTCDICGKMFSFHSSLHRHKLLHQGIRRHRCKKCDKQFSQKCHYNKHKCKSSTSNLCMICGKELSSAASLKNHEMSVHSNSKDFKCPTCDKGFATSGHLKVHVDGAHGAGNHLCPQCGKSFSFMSSFLRHQKYHTGAKPYKCAHCDKSFSQSSHCKAHQMTHTLFENIQCEFCGRKFKNPRNHKHHMKVHHSADSKSYQCHLCNEEFETADILATHVNEKCIQEGHNTVCKTCDKAFPSNSHLVRHMRVHTRERPFVCTICDKAFTQNTHLKSHILRHNKIKPWQCDVCGRSYASRDYLKHHVKKFHEELPDGQVPPGPDAKKKKRTDCEECGKVYKNRKYLKVHMKKKHPGILFSKLLIGTTQQQIGTTQQQPITSAPIEEVRRVVIDETATATQAIATSATQAIATSLTQAIATSVPVPQETLQNLVVYDNRVPVPMETLQLAQATAGLPLQQPQVAAAAAPGVSYQIQVPVPVSLADGQSKEHPPQRKPEEAGPNMIAESMRLITVNWW